MTEEVFDVILQSTGGFRTDIVTFQQHPPPKGTFSLADELWVGSLPNGIRSNLVFDACASAGFNFRPFRQYGMRYAFCRKVNVDQDNYYEWDSQGVLRRTIFLSRLIRPTTIATALSARLYFEDGELKTIVPGPTQVPGSYAWVIAKDDWRDWLSTEEFECLRLLLPRYDQKPLKRISQARNISIMPFIPFILTNDVRP